MFNLKTIALKIRKNILKESYKANACHISSALSAVEILVYLYYKLLKKEDIFIFSKASGAATLYCVLAEKGIIPRSKVAFYLKNYPLVSNEVPSIIWSGGSLGHGLPVAVGLALAKRDRKVYCLMSDAEMQEGTTWETALFARQHKLDNLFVFVDYNHLQACGALKEILDIERLKDKFESFGWEALFTNGHSFEAFNTIFAKEDNSNKDWWQFGKEIPKVIICDTIKGKGVDFMENHFEWHYKNLDKDLLKKALCRI